MRLLSMSAYLIQTAIHNIKAQRYKYSLVMTKSRLLTRENDLSARCLASLGLFGQPFVEHPEVQDLFTDSNLSIPVNILLNYLRNQQMALVVRGESGIGKTTYLRRLLQAGGDSFEFCMISATRFMGWQDIEEIICRRWQVDASKGGLLECLECKCAGDKKPVLVIDNAQLLAPEVLDELLCLKYEIGYKSPSPLGLVFAATPGIECVLAGLEADNPAASQIYMINLRPFNVQQTRAYLLNCLRVTGCRGQDPFSDEDIRKIQLSSGGLPREINRSVTHVLEGLCQDGFKPARRSWFSLGKKTGAYTGMFAAVLVGFVLAYMLGGAVFKTDEQQSVSARQHDAVSAIYEGLNQAVNEVQQKQLPGAAPDSQTEEIINPVSVVTTPSLTEGEPRNVEWLLRQDAAWYAIQIMAVSKLQPLLEFVKQHPLRTNLAYYRTERDGKDWYVLVAGVFPDRAAAEAAIEDMPVEIKANLPWVRQLESLQRAIQNTAQISRDPAV